MSVPSSKWKSKRTHLVYEANFPDGSLYIGRTSITLAARIERHYTDAENGKRRPVLVALREFPRELVLWKVIWQGRSRGQSMAQEIIAIREAAFAGRTMLNPPRRRKGLDSVFSVASKLWGRGEPPEGGGGPSSTLSFEEYTADLNPPEK